MFIISDAAVRLLSVSKVSLYSLSMNTSSNDFHIYARIYVNEFLAGPDPAWILRLGDNAIIQRVPRTDRLVTRLQVPVGADQSQVHTWIQTRLHNFPVLQEESFEITVL